MQDQSTHRCKFGVVIAMFLPFCLAAQVNASDASIAIPPLTPLFAAPDIDSDILSITPEHPVELQQLSEQRVFVESKRVTSGRWHPLMVVTTFHQVQTPRGTMWASMDYGLVNGKVTTVVRHAKWASYGLVIALAVLAVLLAICWRTNLTRALAEYQIAPIRHSLTALAIGLALRAAAVFYVCFSSGSVVVHPTDEAGYFAIGRDILGGVFPGPDWLYTIGQGVIYIPFIWLFDAHRIEDFLLPFSLINAFVIGSVTAALAYWCIEKLTKSTAVALASIILLAVLPLFYIPIENHEDQIFKGLFALPQLSQLSYHSYDLMNWYGYNAMSDMPAAGLLTLCLYLLIGNAGSHRSVILAVAAIFAFACLVRIAGIFFMPVLTCAVIHRLREGKVPVREWGLIFAAGAVVFLLVFMPQFMVNYSNHGGFLSFPYVKHPARAGEGFTITDFLRGAPFLLHCNYVYIVLGTAGLLFTVRTDAGRMLALWSLPMILFYCGYPVIGASPIRFILVCYPALLAAAMLGIRRLPTNPVKGRCVLLLILAANFIAVCPSFRDTPPYGLQLPAGTAIILTYTLIGTSAAVLFVLRRSPLARPALVVLMLFHLGSAYLLAGLMGIILIQTAWGELRRHREAAHPVDTGAVPIRQ